ncbi:tetratricopeptide repeat protein [Caenimonas sedimenti]|uniref:Tetratricopeptide repeat protein 38 n=1 Tax=Caenimonas sedimenti TaxID=2596921 RepID=A0A562ZRE4_9BURK|nr:tetratricopeptide repeat protein [Caenimonas sedimenti]TWO70888.1 tetratricopeptide repeat protein [Caenimonas sedimenti]
MNDSLGLALSGANDASLRAYQAALDQFKCFTGDPAALAQEAITASPTMTMAHVLQAWLHLLGTEPGGVAVARAACAAAAALPANGREQMHLQAATLLAHGHWVEAGRVLEDLSLAWPLDLLALQAGQQVDFFTGDARMLRDRIARALPAWRRGLSGYHAVLSMHAFGLEETGDYGNAEKQGRLAVELEPRDGWGWHAVAHVLEMRNDPVAGAEWLGRNTDTWSEGSFLAVHNWWHLALFQLELGRHDEVLRLYDESIGGPGSSMMLDLVDASAMLWRLQLRGVDIGERWEAVADRWQAAGVPGQMAFNDLHMMMAFVGSGRQDAQLGVLEAQRQAMERDDDNAFFTQAVGYSATRAVQAFGAGDFSRSVQALRAIRSNAHRFGGSHAQRDVLDLTLHEAARRGGMDKLAAGLHIERLALRPRTRQLRAMLLAA